MDGPDVPGLAQSQAGAGRLTGEGQIKVLLFANTDWYLYNFRLALARALREAGAEVLLVSPPGKFGPRLEKEGFRWIVVPMARRSLSPASESRLLVNLARLYRAEQPDIVHHFTIKCVVYGSFAARLAGVRRQINAVTGLGYVFASGDVGARLLKPLVRMLLRLALQGESVRLVVQNADDRSAFLQARLIREAQVRLIRGSGVDTEAFRPTTRSAAQSPLRVLLAARLLWDKGIREYVEAARRMRSAGLPIRFLLAGTPDTGNPAAVPEEVLKQWADEGTITALGHVDDMAELFRRVDLAVLPTYYGEGVPRSLIEAAASGLPAITTDMPGCREIVEHGVNGILVPPRNAAALGEAIQYIYEHPEERIRMGDAGRRRAVQEFDERIVLAETLAVYHELMTGAAASSPT